MAKISFFVHMLASYVDPVLFQTAVGDEFNNHHLTPTGTYGRAPHLSSSCCYLAIVGPENVGFPQSRAVSTLMSQNTDRGQLEGRSIKSFSAGISWYFFWPMGRATFSHVSISSSAPGQSLLLI